MSSDSTTVVCEGCGKPNPEMQCPKCKELGIRGSLFCTQDCFKASWKAHKAKHTQPCINTMTDHERALFNFTGSVRPGKITPKRVVPPHIARPDYADNADGRSPSEEAARGGNIPRWTGKELAQIREVCKLAREVLDTGVAAVKPGVTTDELDRIVHEATVERNMYPSPLNYYNFPKSLCTSVNEVICHGIPDSREMQEGDVVNLDVTTYLNGYHGDLNETVFVGKPQPDDVRVVHCAYECMQAGMGTVAPGVPYKAIGDAIEARAALSSCSVVRTYTGHGIGSLFHTAPTVPHYGNNRAVGVMKAGHVFTIEPMINLGSYHDVTWPDNWTSTTRDGKRSAQFEQTFLCTDNGIEILTDYVDHVPTYRKQLDTWGIAPIVSAAPTPQAQAK